MHSPKILLLLLGLAWTPVSAAEVISNQPLAFRWTVPEGFRRSDEKPTPDQLYIYESPAKGKSIIGHSLMITRLRRTIGREKRDVPSTLPNNIQASVVAEKWKSFDIEVMRIASFLGRNNELPTVDFNVVVPLATEAILISVSGDADHEEESRNALRTVLASLEGETNWLTEQQQVRKLGKGVATIAIVVGVVIVVALGTAFALRSRTRSRKPVRRRRERED